MTAKCNLACSYCILENAPYQIKQELNITEKERLISHLYNKLNIRSITLSGGEPLIIGQNHPSDFIRLLCFLKQFKSNKTKDNLIVKLYTNGLLLTDEIASYMKDVIDEASINIDSCNNNILRRIGRSKTTDYYINVLESIKSLYKYKIPIKLHSVINAINAETIGEEVSSILQDVKKANPLLQSWKFFQYMSYDNPDKDSLHKISNEEFNRICERIHEKLNQFSIKLQFKSNKEMEDSLFNILATGIVQYRKPGDTWTTTQRTKMIFEYCSMEQLLKENHIDIELFKKYHQL